jgi:hypothetical protein
MNRRVGRGGGGFAECPGHFRNPSPLNPQRAARRKPFEPLPQERG